jgi:hypothetical protein
MSPNTAILLKTQKIRTKSRIFARKIRNFAPNSAKNQQKMVGNRAK